ncbi:MAG: DUF192 domain-containing protein [Candidatus Aenigmarchaeota archaeon]|nr:DUF192 domain-containing protein [Candidatus Aenigmarchaeota archaeon]
MKWFIMTLTAVILIIFILAPLDGSEAELSSVRVGNMEYKVEIADSYDERTAGLMHRPLLEEDHGMLFVFPNEDYHPFWMRNTLIPLDIIFISADLRVVDTVSLRPCVETCEAYVPKEKALFVLEVNSGSGIAKEENVVIG